LVELVTFGRIIVVGTHTNPHTENNFIEEGEPDAAVLCSKAAGLLRP